jgi:hypothetical protein
MSTTSPLDDHAASRRWSLADPVTLVVIFVVLLLLRRGYQLISPEVWDEEGTQILRDFIAQGPLAIFQPLNGYLVIAPRLLCGAAYLLSFAFYPYLSTIFTWLFILGALLVIALHPSKLAGGGLLSLAVLLVPTDPETFGIPLYAFWWASLLLFVALFWDERTRHLPWRLGCVILGGLSSPMIVPGLPLFWVRAVLYRRQWREWLLAGAATLCFAVQVAIIAGAGDVGRRPALNAEVARATLNKFFAYYAVGQMRVFREPWILALLCILILAVIGVALWRQRRSPTLWFLGMLLFAAVALAITRVDVAFLHPVHAGPRYFFFPYLLMSWLLLQIVYTERQTPWLRRTAQVLLAFSVVNAVPHFGRGHDDLDWRGHVASAVHFDRFAIPVQYDGAACRAWYLRVTGEQAAAQLARDPLARWNRNRAVYPFTAAVFDADAAETGRAAVGSLQNNGWHDATVPGTTPAGCVVFRSTGQSESRTLTCRLRRGQAILFRSSQKAFGVRVAVDGGQAAFATRVLPSTAWTWLEFSNRLLPETFTLTLEDRGTDPRQWAEVAVAR